MRAEELIATDSSVQQRFWAKVDRRGEDECWLWTGAVITSGYGHMSVGGRAGTQARAPRLSWILHNGPIPEGMQACHKCDVRLCVNPKHLFLGTNAENARDMAQKGRQWRQLRPGAPRRLLNARQVAFIRLFREFTGATQSSLAKKYGVHVNTINSIVNGNSWA